MKKFALFLLLIQCCALHAGDSGSAEPFLGSNDAGQRPEEQEGIYALLQEFVNRFDHHQRATNASIVNLAKEIEGLGERVWRLEQRKKKRRRLPGITREVCDYKDKQGGGSVLYRCAAILL